MAALEILAADVSPDIITWLKNNSDDSLKDFYYTYRLTLVSQQKACLPHLPQQNSYPEARAWILSGSLNAPRQSSPLILSTQPKPALEPRMITVMKPKLSPLPAPLLPLNRSGRLA